MPRYRLTVAYDGTDFHGWQEQNPPDVEPLRTVQQTLQNAVREVVREPVIVTGASRTDSGVHALGQTAAFTTENPMPPERMSRAINSRLPDDVQVRSAVVTRDDFDPIADAVDKSYRYRIKHSCLGETESALPPLFDRRQIFWTAHTLDPKPMQDAANLLVGEHDFACLTKLDHGRATTVRTIHTCDITATDERHLHLDVSGSGFLYNMVRIIAGTLVEVGRGKRTIDDIRTMLANNDRELAGPTLPPHGLCLMWIRYPEDADTL